MTMNNPECDYSFEMLYKAAYGKRLSKKAKNSLQSLDQVEINELVTLWAKRANWKTIERNGEDGKKYLAFYP